MAREYDHLFKLLMIGDSGNTLLVLTISVLTLTCLPCLYFQAWAKALYYYALQTILLQEIILQQ